MNALVFWNTEENNDSAWIVVFLWRWLMVDMLGEACGSIGSGSSDRCWISKGWSSVEGVDRHSVEGVDKLSCEGVDKISEEWTASLSCEGVNIFSPHCSTLSSSVIILDIGWTSVSSTNSSRTEGKGGREGSGGDTKDSSSERRNESVSRSTNGNAVLSPWTTSLKYSNRLSVLRLLGRV